MYSSVANFAVFPRIRACFYQVAGYLKTCVLLVLFEICLFFTNFCVLQIAFFNLMVLLKFQFTAKGNLCVFL